MPRESESGGSSSQAESGLRRASELGHLVALNVLPRSREQHGQIMGRDQSFKQAI